MHIRCVNIVKLCFPVAFSDFLHAICLFPLSFCVALPSLQLSSSPTSLFILHIASALLVPSLELLPFITSYFLSFLLCFQSVFKSKTSELGPTSKRQVFNTGLLCSVSYLPGPSIHSPAHFMISFTSSQNSTAYMHHHSLVN